MSTKIFHPAIKVAKLAKDPSKIDIAACLAIANRSRATDMLLLCFGIGIGVLLYALVHDIILRFRSEPESTLSLCDCSSRNRPVIVSTLSHSHHLSTSTSPSHHVPGNKYLIVPSIRRPILADEKV